MVESMKRYCLSAMALSIALFASLTAAPPESPFPAPPPVTPPAPLPAPPGATVNIAAGQLYVVDWTADGDLHVYPEGLVTVKKIAKTPATMYGVFAGGNGQEEERTFNGPCVYVLKAVPEREGSVGLALYPFGYKTPAEAKKTAITVNGGQGPIPPPKPKPKPDPDPDHVKVDSVFVIVVEKAGAPRTLETAAALNDPFWESLRPKNDFRHYLSNAPVAVANNYTKIADSVGYPAVIVLENGTGKVLDKFPLATIAGVSASVKKWAK